VQGANQAIYSARASCSFLLLPANTSTKMEDEPLHRQARIAQLLQGGTVEVPPKVKEVLTKLEPLITVIAKVVAVVGPLYVKAGVAIYKFCDRLPWDALLALVGLGMCFFGGHYAASIAAIEAFALAGWPETRRRLTAVLREFKLVAEANAIDNKKDDDGDGIPDAKQLPPNELLQRKLLVAAAAVKQPDDLVKALGGLYTSWLAVQGTLRIQFARTVALAVSIASLIEMPLLKIGLPLLSRVAPVEIRHWLPTIISAAVKAFVVALAWSLQTIISAAQSALRGGLLFSRSILNLAKAKGVTKLGPISLSHEETYVDELLGFGLAAIGFATQFSFGFTLPFPFNVVMLPFTLVEWYIRWSITAPALAAASS